MGISVCDLCIDIVTDIDEWLTAEHTEADIVAWVEQVQEQLYVYPRETNQVIWTGLDLGL